MCYMKKNNRVGVRELRQNLSVYLRKVSRGRDLEITDRGKLVAMLIPASDQMTELQRLIASGRATPAKGNLADLGPPLKVKLDRPLTEILNELREERL